MFHQFKIYNAGDDILLCVLRICRCVNGDEIGHIPSTSLAAMSQECAMLIR